MKKLPVGVLSLRLFAEVKDTSWYCRQYTFYWCI